MAPTTFSISDENSSDYCFTPLVCPTIDGHLVVWCQTPFNCSEAVIKTRSYYGDLAGTIKTIPSKGKICNLESLSPYGDYYLLLVHIPTGYAVYELDKSGNIHKEYIYHCQEVIVKCDYNIASNCTVLYLYDHKRNMFIVATVETGKSWSDMTIVDEYHNVWGVPIVCTTGDDYFVAWITQEDDLKIVTNNIHKDSEKQVRITPYNVDYLIGSRCGNHTFVIGGYCTKENLLRIDFCQINDNRINVYTRTFRDDNYKGYSFSLQQCSHGVMLLADGPNTGVYSQYFTEIGGYLYPFSRLENSEEMTWSPVLSGTTDQSLAVYIKDYSDTNNPHSIICGSLLYSDLTNLTKQIQLADAL